MNIEHIIPLFQNITEPLTGLTLDLLYRHISLTKQNEVYELSLQFGFPVQPMQGFLQREITGILKQHYPDTVFKLVLAQNILSHQTQMPGSFLRGVKNVIVVGSGKGGVGKSTVSVNLAAALSKAGARVGILDADIYGPSIPTMLGGDVAIEMQGDKYRPAMRHGLQAMSIGYLAAQDEALIWRGPMLAKALIQLIDITAWDNLDYLFIDLPPGTGDIQLSLVQKIPVAGAIVVTTPQQVATLDAQKALRMFARTNIHVLGVVENMALHECSQCGHTEAIFGNGGASALAKEAQTILLGQLALDKNLCLAADAGKTAFDIPELTALQTAILASALRASILLAHRNQNFAGKIPPVVTE